MRIPCLPIFIDEFGLGSDTSLRTECTNASCRDRIAQNVYILSHFHTDHMSGLTPLWRGGPIVCTAVTQQLVVQRFGEVVGRLTVALPFWRRTAMLQAAGNCTMRHHEEPRPNVALAAESSSSGSSTTIHVTLIPAFHIPGSAMAFLETPLGNLLYTGDFKFHAMAREQLSLFLESQVIDHLYIDDTWLHLGKKCLDSPVHQPRDGRPKRPRRDTDVRVDEPHSAIAGCRTSSVPYSEATNYQRSNSGSIVLSHLLNDEQLSEAFEALHRRMAYQKRLYLQESKEQRVSDVPYILRVYLHNHFGKELLVQRLAICLGTRILVDDLRYARLKVVDEVFRGDGENPEDPRGTHLSTDPHGSNCTLSGTCDCRLMDLLRERWLASGGERTIYGIDLKHFVSISQLNAHRHQSPPVSIEYPLIEVVNSRKEISSQVLARLSRERSAPHFGVAMSGWSHRIQDAHQHVTPRETETWHIPTTLHSTPQEIINFVALVRPISVTPLHYAPHKEVLILQRLGPVLRTPYANEYLKLYGPTQDALRLTPFAFLLHSVVPESPNSNGDGPRSLGFRFQRTQSFEPAGGEEYEEGECVHTPVESVSPRVEEEDRSEARRRTCATDANPARSACIQSRNDVAATLQRIETGLDEVQPLFLFHCGLCTPKTITITWSNTDTDEG